MQIRPLRQFSTVSRCGRWQSLMNSNLTRNSAKKACSMATRLPATTSLENLGYEDSNKDCEMVKILCKEGRLQEALQVLGLVNKRDPRIVSMAYVSILKACGNRKDVSDLKKVHAHIMQSKHCTDLFVVSTLISMYAKSSSLADARKVFDSISVRDAVSWNTIIAGYAKQGNGKEAINLFSQMTQAGLKPDRVSFMLLLGACASLGDFEKAYAKVGQGEPALTLWQQMKQEKVKPNKVMSSMESTWMR
ncbi:hypothetical protein O6H91_15G014600 [Diphasiastrum complanatum]|uniref:Uncharacterized protein n=1 Tax=Diphasiastrum complanatum TaxID=34168 RepID=A0ACC2BG08_DIPCM|nr:hypothetical protein O6H91_15G014600 [Diphasiastrum complanatum]